MNVKNVLKKADLKTIGKESAPIIKENGENAIHSIIKSGINNIQGIKLIAQKNIQNNAEYMPLDDAQELLMPKDHIHYKNLKHNINDKKESVTGVVNHYMDNMKLIM